MVYIDLMKSMNCCALLDTLDVTEAQSFGW